jgi:hypothetical protein
MKGANRGSEFIRESGATAKQDVLDVPASSRMNSLLKFVGNRIQPAESDKDFKTLWLPTRWSSAV